MKPEPKIITRSSEEAWPAVDPAAAVIPALSALGAVSSIAASLWIGSADTPVRGRPPRKAVHALRDLESDCLVLQSIFRRLGRGIRGLGGAGEKGVATAPLKFGLHGLDIADADLLTEIGQTLGSTSTNALAVMHAVARGAIDAPEDIFYGFGECQDRLNRVIAERPSMRTAIDIGLESAMRLTELVNELKRHAKD